MLTQEEIKQYNELGYVIPRNFKLESVILAGLQSALEFVLKTNPEIPPDRIVNPHLNGAKPYGVKGHKRFNELVYTETILEMAADVLGPDLILLFTHLFCKNSKSTRVVPWHQDGPFWPVKPMKSCTVWLALDDVDKENGAMKVIPCSHLGKALNHNLITDPNSTLNRELPALDVDEQSSEYIELEAGQVSIHDIGLIHSSAANSSGRRRAGLALRYMPSCCHMFRTMPDAAASWEDMPMELVSGKNIHPGNNFSLGDFGKPW